MCQLTTIYYYQTNIPVLKPNLDGSLRHIYFLRDTLANTGGWSRVFVELNLEEDKLVLGGPLAFLVFLLLSESTLSWRST